MFYKFKYTFRRILRLLPDKSYLKIVYLLTFKRRLNLKRPKYWTEKMQYKKLYDRRELVTNVADKVKVREYSYNKLDIDIMPEILWIGKNPENIPFNALPNTFVIKTNHGSSTNIIVENKEEIDQEDIIKKVKEWLSFDYYYLEKEWAYKNIERKVFVEELSYDEDGNLPSDIKLYMFNGRLGAINIHIDRFKDSYQNILVDKDFKLLDGTIDNSKYLVMLKPKLFNTMVNYAEKLSTEFDFIRVDFYDLGSKVVLRELTNYPVGGFKRMQRKQTNI